MRLLSWFKLCISCLIATQLQHLKKCADTLNQKEIELTLKTHTKCSPCCKLIPVYSAAVYTKLQ